MQNDQPPPYGYATDPNAQHSQQPGQQVPSGFAPQYSQQPGHPAGPYGYGQNSNAPYTPQQQAQMPEKSGQFGYQQQYQPAAPQPFKPNRVICATYHSVFTKSLMVFDQTQELLARYPGDLTDSFSETSKDLGKKADSNSVIYTLVSENWKGTELHITAGKQDGQVLIKSRNDLRNIFADEITFPSGSKFGSQTIEMNTSGITGSKESFEINGVSYVWKVAGNTKLKNRWELFVKHGGVENEIAKFHMNSKMASRVTLVLDNNQVDETLAIFTAVLIVWKQTKRAAQKAN